MKKALSILLSLAMVMSLSVSVFAADNKELDLVSDNTATFDIGGTLTAVKAENETAYVYSVTISWEYDTDYEALFSKQVMYEWDPTTLMYSLSEDSNEDYVSDNADPINVKITMTNKSNNVVDYEISYADADDGFKTTSQEKDDLYPTPDYSFGTLESADTSVGASYTDDVLCLDKTDSTSLGTAGTAQTLEYFAVISIEYIDDITKALDGSDTVGTYTITLGDFAW